MEEVGYTSSHQSHLYKEGRQGAKTVQNQSVETTTQATQTKQKISKGGFWGKECVR